MGCNFCLVLSLQFPDYTFFSRFSQVRFVDGDELRASGLPVSPEEFQELVRKQCVRTREFLKKT